MPDSPGAADSVLGRLLQEISWSGSTVRDFRDGGRGHENVLTAETLTALDFLPRQDFLGAVVSAAAGADRARASFASESEAAVLTLLPDQLWIGSEQRPRDRVGVQPDGIMVSPSCFVLLEAKRIGPSSFQPEQLAREYVALLEQARGRSPLLLLLLGAPPPVTVRGHGKLSLTEAVDVGLLSVLKRIGDNPSQRASLLDQLPDVVAWITWQQMADTVMKQQERVAPSTASLDACVARLVESLLAAIARHA